MELGVLAGWDPAALDELGDELEKRAQALGAMREAVGEHALFGGDWHGDAHRAAVRSLDEFGTAVGAHSDSFLRVAACARGTASRLRELRAELDVVLGSSTGTDDERQRILLGQLLVRADALDGEASVVLAREPDGAAPTEGSGTLPHNASPGSGSSAAVPDVPAAGTDPEVVAQWWRGLDDATRAAVLAGQPERIGGLDGIPAAVRDDANRARLDAERARLAAVAVELQAELDGMWQGDGIFGRAGLTGLFTDADAGLEQTRNKLEALDAIEAALAHGDRQLLALDLTGREAMAAVAVGDVDTADHVAVYTPGAGSTVQGNLDGYDRQVAALRESALSQLNGTDHPDDTVAAVTWLGYQAPQWGWGLAFTERSPVSDLAAQIAAPRLAGFLDGIAAARADDPHVTAVGHSYGALVTGLALQQTGADAAVFLGAPGLGTADVGTLGIPPGSAYLVEADRDPVADAGTFGRDPSFLDGLTHLPTGATTTPTGLALDEITGHSSYLQPGTTSAHHVAAVVANVTDENTTDRGTQ